MGKRWNRLDQHEKEDLDLRSIALIQLILKMVGTSPNLFHNRGPGIENNRGWKVQLISRAVGI